MAIQCICGRDIGPKPHCPSCGSNFTYATPSKDKRVTVDGEEYVIRAFNCRFCSISYNEADKCLAPPPRIRKVTTPMAKRYINQDNFARALDNPNEAVVKMYIEQVKSGERPMTQAFEDRCQKDYGISMSERSHKPIIDAPLAESGAEFHQTSIEVLRELGLPDPDNILGSPDNDDPFKTGT